MRTRIELVPPPQPLLEKLFDRLHRLPRYSAVLLTLATMALIIGMVALEVRYEPTFQPEVRQ